MKNWKEKGHMIRSKEKENFKLEEKSQLVSSQQ
jgi:hypothetical protein